MTRVTRRQATRMLLVMAVLLGSPWAGGLATTAGDSAAAQLTAGRLLLSLEPAVRDRLPALRPSAERPSSAGRPGSLLGLLVAALAAAFARRARHHASGPAGTRSLGLGSRRDARAPPLLQPA